MLIISLCHIYELDSVVKWTLGSRCDIVPCALIGTGIIYRNNKNSIWLKWNSPLILLLKRLRGSDCVYILETLLRHKLFIVPPLFLARSSLPRYITSFPRILQWNLQRSYYIRDIYLDSVSHKDFLPRLYSRAWGFILRALLLHFTFRFCNPLSKKPGPHSQIAPACRFALLLLELCVCFSLSCSSRSGEFWEDNFTKIKLLA